MNISKTAIALAVAVVLVPLAFLVGKGCAPTRTTAAVITPSATHGAGEAQIQFRDSTRWHTRIRLVSMLDSLPPSFPIPDSLPLLDSFTVCGGALLPSGDSVHSCFESPANQFTFDLFPAPRVTPAPDTITVYSAPPINAHFLAALETSTRDPIALGVGGEVTADDKVRVTGEAMVLPKVPFGYLKLRVEYLF